MSQLFASGRAAEIVLVVVAIEAVMLIAWARWQPLDALLRLAPGALLLVALRQALIGADWRTVALPLLLSFPFHLADLARTARHRAAPRDD